MLSAKTHRTRVPTTDDPAPSQAAPDAAASRPAPTAVDRLQSIYQSPGPFTTVYLATRPPLTDAGVDLLDRWRDLRKTLEMQAAPHASLAAIDARLSLPSPDDAAAIAVIAAADGSTIVEHGLEPPRFDYGTVDTLPHVGPLLEWHQRRIPHLVVTVDGDGADVATFGTDHFTELDSIEGDTATLATVISTAATAIGARLVVVAGDPVPAAHLTDEVMKTTAPWCNVVASLDESTDGLAEATVRHVSDAAARTTVGYLRELRFLATHDAGIDGLSDTITALRSGVPGVLLIHDDPLDQRRLWVGRLPFQLSTEKTTECRKQARLTDAVIWSAIAQGMDVHIIPRTGRHGPDDDTAVIDRRGPDR